MKPALASRLAALALCSSAALLATSAQAAVVTWGPAAGITGDTDVSTNGSLVGAYNFGGSNTTVNGVLFQSLVIGAPQVISAGFGANTLSLVPERNEQTLANFSTGSSIGGSFFQGLSSAYQGLLGSAAGGNFADRVTFLELGALVVGQQYAFQGWFNVSTTEGTEAYGLSISDPDDNSASLSPSTQTDGNNTYVLGGTGQYVVGTFTADATTQMLRIVREEIPGGLNGFQLRALNPTTQVPEPATPALVALALLGLAVARRQAGQAKVKT